MIPFTGLLELTPTKVPVTELLLTELLELAVVTQRLDAALHFGLVNLLSLINSLHYVQSKHKWRHECMVWFGP